MADPVYQSTSNTAYASRTNTTVTAPAGITNGDTLFYAIFAGRAVGSGGYPTVTPPSGFGVLNGGTWPMQIQDGFFEANIYLWYKIASGESGNYTATHASSSTQGVMFRVSGGDGAQPVATTNSGGAEADSTALGVTPAANGALVGVLGWDWGNTTNNLAGPSGTTPTFTERVDVTLTGLWTGNLATAGATGNKTFANNSDPPYPWAAAMFVVEPAAGGSASRQGLTLMGMGR